MEQSYIPDETNVICTNMRVPTPVQIRWNDEERPTDLTFYGTKDKLLLTIADKKLSAQFDCIVPGLFWGGLTALLMGMAVAALAVALVAVAIAATVATGGLAAVAFVVAGAAFLGGVASAITMACKVPHACDITLSSEWKLYHDDVLIENHNALLADSFLKCNKGGIIHTILDPTLALGAAEIISDLNKERFEIHVQSQIIMSIIGTGTSGTDPISLCVNAAISIPSYIWGDNYETDHEELPTNGEVTIDAIAGNVEDQLKSLMVPGVGYGMGAVYKNISKEVGEAVMEQCSEDFLSNFQLRNAKGELNGSMIVGWAGFLANTAISIYANIKMNNLLKAVVGTSRGFNETDLSNDIGIVADNM